MKDRSSSLKKSHIHFEDENPFLFLNQIKKGDVFYDYERGVNIKMEALSDAKEINEGWSCKVKTSKGEQFIYAIENTYYKPIFFWFPYYSSYNSSEKNLIFVIE